MERGNTTGVIHEVELPTADGFQFCARCGMAVIVPPLKPVTAGSKVVMCLWPEGIVVIPTACHNGDPMCRRISIGVSDEC